MNRLISVALITVGTILGTALARADNAVYSCVDAYGVESLTNVPIDANCKRLFTYTMPTPSANEATAPATPAPAPVASTSAAGSVAVAQAAAPVQSVSRKAALVNGQPPMALPRTPLEERLALRRDAALEQTRAAYNSDLPVVGLNRAVNRRYLMTNRAAYQKAIGFMQD